MNTIRAFFAHFRATYRGRCYYHHGEAWPQGIGVAAVPRWVVWLDRMVTRPLFAFEQAWICEVWFNSADPDNPRPKWLIWPGVAASRLFHLLYFRVMEPRCRHYRWNRPLSDSPNEIGFHSYVDRYDDDTAGLLDARDLLESMRDDPSGPSKRSPMRLFVGDGTCTCTVADCDSCTTWVQWDGDGTSFSYTTG